MKKHVKKCICTLLTIAMIATSSIAVYAGTNSADSTISCYSIHHFVNITATKGSGTFTAYYDGPTHAEYGSVSGQVISTSGSVLGTYNGSYSSPGQIYFEVSGSVQYGGMGWFCSGTGSFLGVSIPPVTAYY